MGNIDFKIEPLFAEPLFRTNISSAISEEQIRFIQKLNIILTQNILSGSSILSSKTKILK